MSEFIKNNKQKIALIIVTIMLLLSIPVIASTTDTTPPTITPQPIVEGTNRIEGEMLVGTVPKFRITDDTKVKYVYYTWNKHLDGGTKKPSNVAVAGAPKDTIWSVPNVPTQPGLYELSVFAYDGVNQCGEITLAYKIVEKLREPADTDLPQKDLAPTKSKVKIGTTIPLSFKDDTEIYFIQYRWVEGSQADLKDFNTNAIRIYKPENGRIEAEVPSTPGTYILQWFAKDFAGNISKGNYTTPMSVKNDIIGPTIELNGDKEVYLDITNIKEYHDAGATAQDNLDGNIEVKIDTSDVDNAIKNRNKSKAEVTFTAEDNDGNITTSKRTVYIVDYTEVNKLLEDIDSKIKNNELQAKDYNDNAWSDFTALKEEVAGMQEKNKSTQEQLNEKLKELNSKLSDLQNNKKAINEKSLNDKKKELAELVGEHITSDTVSDEKWQEIEGKLLEKYSKNSVEKIQDLIKEAKEQTLQSKFEEVVSKIDKDTLVELPVIKDNLVTVETTNNSPEFAKVGDTVQFTFETNVNLKITGESPKTTAKIKIGNTVHDVEVESVGGTKYKFSYKFTEGDLTEGKISYELNLVETRENASKGPFEGNGNTIVTFDKTAPNISLNSDKGITNDTTIKVFDEYTILKSDIVISDTYTTNAEDIVIKVKIDGSQEVLLEEGIKLQNDTFKNHTITYIAIDKAGNVSEITRNIIVNKADVTSEKLSYELPEDLHYDGSEHKVDVKAKVDGLGSNITVEYYEIVDGEERKLGNEEYPKNAGTYRVKVTIEDEGDTYSSVKDLTLGDFTIEKRDISSEQIQISISGNTVYTGAEETKSEYLVKTLSQTSLDILTIEDLDIKISAYNREKFIDENKNVEEGTLINAGTYTVKTATVQGIGNFVGSPKVTFAGNFVINRANQRKAEIEFVGVEENTVTAVATGVSVRLTNEALGNATVTYLGGTKDVAEIDATSGEITIKSSSEEQVQFSARFNETENYNAGEESDKLTLTITRAKIDENNFSVTVDSNLVYDNNSKRGNVHVNSQVAGLLENNDYVVEFYKIVEEGRRGELVPEPKDAGQYEIVVKLKQSSIYEEKEFAKLGTLVIDPKPITVIINENKDKTYGDLITPENIGLLENDYQIEDEPRPDHSKLTFTLKNADKQLLDAGDYTIEVLCSDANYSVSKTVSGNGKLHVEPISLNDPKVKVEGILSEREYSYDGTAKTPTLENVILTASINGVENTEETISAIEVAGYSKKQDEGIYAEEVKEKNIADAGNYKIYVKANSGNAKNYKNNKEDEIELNGEFIINPKAVAIEDLCYFVDGAPYNEPIEWKSEVTHTISVSLIDKYIKENNLGKNTDVEFTIEPATVSEPGLHTVKVNLKENTNNFLKAESDIEIGTINIFVEKPVIIDIPQITTTSVIADENDKYYLNEHIVDANERKLDVKLITNRPIDKIQSMVNEKSEVIEGEALKLESETENRYTYTFSITTYGMTQKEDLSIEYSFIAIRNINPEDPSDAKTGTVENIYFDKEKPTVSLKPELSSNIFIGDSIVYDDSDVIANDNSNLDCKIEKQLKGDNNNLEDITITYTAVDKAGNKSNPVTRTINVKDYICKIEIVEEQSKKDYTYLDALEKEQTYIKITKKSEQIEEEKGEFRGEKSVITLKQLENAETYPGTVEVSKETFDEAKEEEIITITYNIASTNAPEGKRTLEAKLTVRVEKKTPTIEDFNITNMPENTTYNGVAIQEVEYTKNDPKMDNDITIKYYKVNELEEQDLMGELPKEAGTYRVKIHVGSGTNYKESDEIGEILVKEFTISPKDISEEKITVKLSGSKDYEPGKQADNIVIEVEPSEVREYIDINVEEYTRQKFTNGSDTVGKESVINAGTYTISKLTITAKDNYQGELTEKDVTTEGTYVINRIDPKLEDLNIPNLETVTYNGRESSVDITTKATGMEEPQEKYYKYDDASENKKGEALESAPKNAGKYLIEAYIPEGENYKEGSILLEDKTLTIEQKSISEEGVTITANLTSPMEQYIYDGKTKEPAITAKVKLSDAEVAQQSEEELEVEITGYKKQQADGSYPAEITPIAEETTIKEAGTYKIYVKVTAKETGNYKNNKEDVEVAETITVEKETPKEMHFNKIDKQETYAGEAKQVTIEEIIAQLKDGLTGLSNNITVKYYLDDEEETPIDVGTYEVRIIVNEEGENFKKSVSDENITGEIVIGQLVIEPAELLTVTYPEAGNITYRESLNDSKLTLEGEELTEGVSEKLGTFSWVDGETKPNAGENQNFLMKFEPNEQVKKNYKDWEPKQKEVTITVEKATLTLDDFELVEGIVGEEGKYSISKPYNGEEQTVEVKAKDSVGNVGTINISVGGKEKQIDHGTYTVTITTTVMESEQCNYNQIDEAIEIGTFTIDKKELSIADIKNKIVEENKEAENWTEGTAFIGEQKIEWSTEKKVSTKVELIDKYIKELNEGKNGDVEFTVKYKKNEEYVETEEINEPGTYTVEVNLKENTNPNNFVKAEENIVLGTIEIYVETPEIEEDTIEISTETGNEYNGNYYLNENADGNNKDVTVTFKTTRPIDKVEGTVNGKDVSTVSLNKEKEAEGSIAEGYTYSFKITTDGMNETENGKIVCSLTPVKTVDKEYRGSQKTKESDNIYFDKTNPKITLNMDKVINKFVGEDLEIDETVTSENRDIQVNDLIPYDISVNIENTNKQEGIVTVTYTVTDKAGNKSTEQRTIDVKDYIADIKIENKREKPYEYGETLSETETKVTIIMKSEQLAGTEKEESIGLGQFKEEYSVQEKGTVEIQPDLPITFNSIGDNTITVTYKAPEGKAPAEAKEITKQLEINVIKRMPTLDDLQITIPEGNKYTGKHQGVQVEAKGIYQEELGNITLEYSNTEAEESSWTSNAIDAGTYKIKVTIKESTNMQGAEFDLDALKPSEYLYNIAKRPITDKDIVEINVELENADGLKYTGKEVEDIAVLSAIVKIQDIEGEENLEANIEDYTYKKNSTKGNPLNAGDYTVNITLNAENCKNYTGTDSIEKEIQIAKIDPDDTNVTGTIDGDEIQISKQKDTYTQVEYNKAPHTVVVTSKDNLKQDPIEGSIGNPSEPIYYEIKGESEEKFEGVPTNLGKYVVKVTLEEGINYNTTGENELEVGRFEIVAKTLENSDIEDGDITVSLTSPTGHINYSEKASIEPQITVTPNESAQIVGEVTYKYKEPNGDTFNSIEEKEWNAGEYEVYVTVEGQGNYKGQLQNVKAGTFSIDKIEQPVEVTIEPNEVLLTEDAPKIKFNGKDINKEDVKENATVSYSANNEHASIDGTTGDITLNTKGTVEFTVKFAETKNYLQTERKVSLTIAQGKLTKEHFEISDKTEMEENTKTVTYDGNIQNVTVSSVIPEIQERIGELVQVKYYLNGQGEGTTEPTEAGKYEVRITVTGTENYLGIDEEVQIGYLNISKKDLESVNISAITSIISGEYKYTGEVQNANITSSVRLGSISSPEQLSVQITGYTKQEIEVENPVDAGTYKVHITVSSNGEGNYEGQKTIDVDNFVISPKQISIEDLKYGVDEEANSNCNDIPFGDKRIEWVEDENHKVNIALIDKYTSGELNEGKNGDVELIVKYKKDEKYVNVEQINEPGKYTVEVNLQESTNPNNFVKAEENIILGTIEIYVVKPEIEEIEITTQSGREAEDGVRYLNISADNKLTFKITTNRPIDKVEGTVNEKVISITSLKPVLEGVEEKYVYTFEVTTEDMNKEGAIECSLTPIRNISEEETSKSDEPKTKTEEKIYLDNTKPQIELNELGKETNIFVGEELNIQDSDIKVTENTNYYTIDKTVKVDDENANIEDLDTNTAKTIKITYKVTDYAGNTSEPVELERTINILDYVADIKIRNNKEEQYKYGETLDEEQVEVTVIMKSEEIAKQETNKMTLKEFKTRYNSEEIGTVKVEPDPTIFKSVGENTVTVTYSAPEGKAPEDAKQISRELIINVEKAEPTINHLNNVEMPEGKTYDGDPISINEPTLKDEFIDEMSEPVFRYYKEGLDTYTLVPPTNAGKYTVKVFIAENNNYVEKELEDENWKFEISKKDISTEGVTIQADIEEVNNAMYDKQEGVTYTGTEVKVTKITASVEITGKHETTNELTVSNIQYISSTARPETEKSSSVIIAGEYNVFSDLTIESENYTGQITAKQLEDTLKINKETPNLDQVIVSPDGIKNAKYEQPYNIGTYGEISQEITVQSKDTLANESAVEGSIGKVTPKYYKLSEDGEETQEVSSQMPKDAGIYKLKVNIAEGINFDNTYAEQELEVGVFEIKPKSLEDITITLNIANKDVIPMYDKNTVRTQEDMDITITSKEIPSLTKDDVKIVITSYSMNGKQTTELKNAGTYTATNAQITVSGNKNYSGTVNPENITYTGEFKINKSNKQNVPVIEVRDNQDEKVEDTVVATSEGLKLVITNLPEDNASSKYYSDKTEIAKVEEETGNITINKASDGEKVTFTAKFNETDNYEESETSIGVALTIIRDTLNVEDFKVDSKISNGENEIKKYYTGESLKEEIDELITTDVDSEVKESFIIEYYKDGELEENPTNQGTYIIKVKLPENTSKYSATEESIVVGTLVIDPKPIKVKITAEKTYKYGDEMPLDNLDMGGLYEIVQELESEAVPKNLRFYVEHEDENLLNVGKYDILIACDDANFEVQGIEGEEKFVVEKRDISEDAQEVNMTLSELKVNDNTLLQLAYNNQPKVAEVNLETITTYIGARELGLTGLNSTIKYKLEDSLIDYTPINAGTYKVILVITSEDSDTCNYTGTREIEAGTFTITKLTPTSENIKGILDGDELKTLSKDDYSVTTEYNTEKHEVTVTAKGNYNDDSTIGKPSEPIYYKGDTKLDEAPTDVGQYVVKVTLEEGINYNKVDTELEVGKFEILPEELEDSDITINLPEDRKYIPETKLSASVTYSEKVNSSVELGKTQTNESITYKQILDNGNESDIAEAPTNAGRYKVYVKVTVTGNYTKTIETSKEFVINKADQITPKVSLDKYEAIMTMTEEEMPKIIVEGEPFERSEATIIYDSNNKSVATVEDGKIKLVGTSKEDNKVTFTVKYSETTNYNESAIATTEELTVKKDTLTNQKVQFSITTKTDDFEYDGTEKTVEISSSMEGILKEQPKNYKIRYFKVLDEELEHEEEISSPKDAGKYRVKVEFFGNEQYDEETLVAGHFTIKKKPITVNADKKEVVYGNQPEALTYTVLEGELVEGEDEDEVLDIQLQRSDSTNRNVGTYNITGTGTADNYEITVNQSTYSITKRPVEITINTTSNEYGIPYSESYLTFTCNDELPYEDTQEDLKVKLQVNSEVKNVGEYKVECITEESNYEVTVLNENNQAYKITKKPITVTADDKWSYFGEDEQELTFKITKGDLAYDDHEEALEVQLQRSDSQNKNVGKYDITGTSTSRNYEVQVISGTYEIRVKDITSEITAEVANNVVYNGDIQHATVTLGPDNIKDSLKEVSRRYVLVARDNVQDTLNESIDEPKNAGTYEAYITVQASGNYEGTAEIKASNNFIIERADSKLEHLVVSPDIVSNKEYKVPYNGVAQTIEVTEKEQLEGFAEISQSDVKYYKDSLIIPEEPINAGVYNVVVIVPDSGMNYKGATIGIGTFEITKADQEKPNIGLFKDDVEVEEIKITEGAPELRVSNKLEAKVGIHYDSTNKEVATIDESGNITIVGGGETTIKVEFIGNENYNSNYAEVTLNVIRETLTERNFTIEDNEFTYDGKTHNPTVKAVGLAGELGTYHVEYYKEGQRVISPIDAGDYEVYFVAEAGKYYNECNIKVGTLSILKRNLVANDLTLTIDELEANILQENIVTWVRNMEHTANVELAGDLRNGTNKGLNFEIEYLKLTDDTKLTTKPVDIDRYRVKVNVTGGENYFDGNFTVAYLTIADRTAPEIYKSRKFGDSEIEVVKGAYSIDFDSFVDVFDDLDGEDRDKIRIDCDTSEFNINKTGSYTIKYTATDSSGNTSEELELTVYVKNLPPVIQVLDDYNIGTEITDEREERYWNSQFIEVARIGWTTGIAKISKFNEEYLSDPKELESITLSEFKQKYSSEEYYNEPIVSEEGNDRVILNESGVYKIVVTTEGDEGAEGISVERYIRITKVWIPKWTLSANGVEGWKLMYDATEVKLTIPFIDRIKNAKIIMNVYKDDGNDTTETIELVANGVINRMNANVDQLDENIITYDIRPDGKAICQVVIESNEGIFAQIENFQIGLD